MQALREDVPEYLLEADRRAREARMAFLDAQAAEREAQEEDAEGEEGGEADDFDVRIRGDGAQ